MSDIYRVECGSRWQRILCAILEHDLYRVRGLEFWEYGCHRCGMMFRHEHVAEKPLTGAPDDR